MIVNKTEVAKPHEVKLNWIKRAWRSWVAAAGAVSFQVAVSATKAKNSIPQTPRGMPKNSAYLLVRTGAQSIVAEKPQPLCSPAFSRKCSTSA